ncbi:MAG: GGDEF domain-containing response regulator [Calditrichaeota bacterium]|nr:GGDEF domain-containing response regulator [Calditrichota bacterium]
MAEQEGRRSVLIASPSLKNDGLVEALRHAPGLDVVEATDPAEAIEVIGRKPLDLILFDWQGDTAIPVELVIRARGYDAGLSIIAVTDDSGRESERLWGLGVSDCLPRPAGPTELLGRVQRSLHHRSLEQQCDHLNRENKKLYEMSVTDGLTKLVNRRHLSERLTAEFSRAIRFSGRFGLLIIDIDHFKKVNDRFGHLAGDRVLVEVSRLIKESLRSIDTAGRYGGEEFVVLLPETACEGVAFVAERLRRSIEECDLSALESDLPLPSHVTVSIGGAVYPDQLVRTGEELLETADRSLYAAKQNGRNRVEIC